MSRSYSICSSVTTPSSGTLPVANVLATAAVRPKICELLMGGSGTPGDNGIQMTVRRCSSAGTPGSSPTPAPLDPADPAASSSAGLAVFSVGPTLGTTLLQWGQNHRATFRFSAAPGRELKAPATANNGLALMNPSAASTFALDFTIVFEE